MTLLPEQIKYVGRDFTEAEARALTASARGWIKTFFLKIEEAHLGRAWIPMGYPSFEAYLDGEFDMSRSRGYQLLAQARNLRLLAGAAGLEAESMSTMVDIPERALRALDVEAAAADVAANVDPAAPEAERAEEVQAAVARQTTTKTETFAETTTTEFDAETGEIVGSQDAEPSSPSSPAGGASASPPAGEPAPEGSSSLTGDEDPVGADVSTGSENVLSAALQARPKLNKAIAAMDAAAVALMDADERRSWQRTVDAVADWVDAWSDALSAPTGLTLIEGEAS